MNLENLIAVSSMPGIYKMAANRSNGLIVENIDTGKKKFAPSRKHQFTPLESISIFTDDGDSVALKNVFRNMIQQIEDNPLPATNAPSDELREYFFDILPNHDEDKVYISDIKKIIKWYTFLDERNMLSGEDEVEEAGEKEETPVAVAAGDEEE